MNNMTSKDFLVEIGTEELPPKALLKLSTAFAANVRKALHEASLEFGPIQPYATPRRLALLVNALQTKQADRQTMRVGPALAAAFDAAGKPTKAAEGFARSCGVALSEPGQLEQLDHPEQSGSLGQPGQLGQVNKGGVSKLACVVQQPGQQTAALLPELITKALAALPIPKRMRWGSSRAEFIRPVHWLLMLLGSAVVPATILGARSSNTTRGHRFHGNKAIVISSPAEYETLLETEGRVIANFAKRRELIHEQVLTAAGKLQAQAGLPYSLTAQTMSDGVINQHRLLDEVTALVELPVALTGKFDPEFLQVPGEALVLAMETHQKCFCLWDNKGALLPNFITISNLASTDSTQVVAGNERVIRPRLADARFFYDSDRKQSLESRREQLKQIVFQEQLGNVYTKSERVAKLAAYIATRLIVTGIIGPATETGADPELCKRAAELAKCDLLSSMVGEFPDLQGIMGCYYAQHDGESEQVATAIREQYYPRFAGDKLPRTLTGSVLALADKLDTIVGMFAIGQAPTGSKDPFALRRAAIGVQRILVENKFELDVYAAIETAVAMFNGCNNSTTGKVLAFLLERFGVWYQEQGVPTEVFLAVRDARPPGHTVHSPRDFDDIVRAVLEFKTWPQAPDLIAANKRVSNILAKHEVLPEVDASLFEEAAEKNLYQAAAKCVKNLQARPGKSIDTLRELANLHQPVNRFFDKVLVMCEDEKQRNNRLALLRYVRDLFLMVADISCLHQEWR